MHNTVNDTLQRVSRDLEAARQQLLDEISTYPTPISGCDAQFNHLISLRAQVGDALAVLSQPVFVPTPRKLSCGEEAASR